MIEQEIGLCHSDPLFKTFYRSDFGSNGSMSDPMYKNIRCPGEYVPMTGRHLRRQLERQRRKEMKTLRGRK